MKKKLVAIVGGGAAGFFSAICIKEKSPETDVIIFEKTGKLLSKVKISGGGRCNITNDIAPNSLFCKQYPRGKNFLNKATAKFSNKDTKEWFINHGVYVKTEDDLRVFPKSNSSESIINCFLELSTKYHIVIKTNQELTSIRKTKNNFELLFKLGANYTADYVIIATGGSQNESAYSFLSTLGHRIQKPCPSLFTFNFKQHPFKNLMGLVAPNTHVKILQSTYEQSGPLLITHWGLSGPVILKLSAFAAPYLNASNYNFSIKINWINTGEKEARKLIEEYQLANGKKKISTNPILGLPARLWLYLCEQAEIEENKIWQEIAKKSYNKLIDNLINTQLQIEGKTTFKEEFVTCGGISLDDIHESTMQSKIVENLYFAGEVIDVDGVTGGFNFQNAWTTAFIAANDIASKLKI